MVNKEHHFNIEVAQKTSIESAIIYYNLCYWISKNEANKTNFFDGNYWTYNSVEAFLKLFPYMTKHKINKSLKELEDAGMIITGNYNQSTYDRTKWYSIPMNTHFRNTTNGDVDFKKCNSEIEKMDLSENRNPIVENQKPIPYNKPNSNTDSNTDKIKNFSKKDFKEELLNLGALEKDINDWLKIKKMCTERALDLLISECTKNNFKISDAVKLCADHGWQTFKFFYVRDFPEYKKQVQENNNLFTPNR